MICIPIVLLLMSCSAYDNCSSSVTITFTMYFFSPSETISTYLWASLYHHLPVLSVFSHVSCQFVFAHIFSVVVDPSLSRRCIRCIFIYTTKIAACVCVCAKFDQFLPVRSQFDSNQHVNSVRIATFQSANFGPLLFAFYCPLFFYENKIKNE